MPNMRVSWRAASAASLSRSVPPEHAVSSSAERPERGVSTEQLASHVGTHRGGGGSKIVVPFFSRGSEALPGPLHVELGARDAADATVDEGHGSVGRHPLDHADVRHAVIAL